MMSSSPSSMLISPIADFVTIKPLKISLETAIKSSLLLQSPEIFMLTNPHFQHQSSSSSSLPISSDQQIDNNNNNNMNINDVNQSNFIDPQKLSISLNPQSNPISFFNQSTQPANPFLSAQDIFSTLNNNNNNIPSSTQISEVPSPTGSPSNSYMFTDSRFKVSPPDSPYITPVPSPTISPRSSVSAINPYHQINHSNNNGHHNGHNNGHNNSHNNHITVENINQSPKNVIYLPYHHQQQTHNTIHMNNHDSQQQLHVNNPVSQSNVAYINLLTTEENSMINLHKPNPNDTTQRDLEVLSTLSTNVSMLSDDESSTTLTNNNVVNSLSSSTSWDSLFGVLSDDSANNDSMADGEDISYVNNLYYK
eukprot:TRINITY_DN4116_c2_g1_i1.p1 TRINITY_DN4116_c2_g1~~TRINITY_DN4116_c2_g1_i1.p1  ORF type:complete len:365 (+),score=92.99 TRINITY_DN4116_c2_g1_i1:994-2088(+)